MGSRELREIAATCLGQLNHYLSVRRGSCPVCQNSGLARRPLKIWPCKVKSLEAFALCACDSHMGPARRSTPPAPAVCVQPPAMCIHLCGGLPLVALGSIRLTSRSSESRTLPVQSKLPLFVESMTVVRFGECLPNALGRLNHSGVGKIRSAKFVQRDVSTQSFVFEDGGQSFGLVPTPGQRAVCRMKDRAIACHWAKGVLQLKPCDNAPGISSAKVCHTHLPAGASVSRQAELFPFELRCAPGSSKSRLTLP